jgi:transposase InsO family protein
MKEQNFKAIQPKSFKPRITDSKGVKAATNLLAEIHIEECAVGKIIIGSITYLPLRGGAFCYLAVWQDKVTRRVISWSLAATLEAELVISALEKAIRKGLIKAAPIIHSDQVSQCASTAFQGLLRICCFRQSMSGRGNCYDNAQAETFFLPI